MTGVKQRTLNDNSTLIKVGHFIALKFKDDRKAVSFYTYCANGAAGAYWS